MKYILLIIIALSFGCKKENKVPTVINPDPSPNITSIDFGGQNQSLSKVTYSVYDTHFGLGQRLGFQISITDTTRLMIDINGNLDSLPIPYTFTHMFAPTNDVEIWYQTGKNQSYRGCTDYYLGSQGIINATLTYRSNTRIKVTYSGYFIETREMKDSLWVSGNFDLNYTRK